MSSDDIEDHSENFLKCHHIALIPDCGVLGLYQFYVPQITQYL